MQGDTGRWESYPRQHAVGGDEASDSVSDSISNSRMDSISDGGRDSIRVSDSDGGSGSVSNIPLSPSPLAHHPIGPLSVILTKWDDRLLHL